MQDRGRINWLPKKKVWRVFIYKGSRDVRIGDYTNYQEAVDVLQKAIKT